MKVVLIVVLVALTGCRHMAHDRALAQSLQNANEQMAAPAPARVDMKCMNSCTSRGFLIDFCKSKCSY